MRYAVMARELTISQLQDEVKKCGARNLRVATASKQVFCNLDLLRVVELRARGYSVISIGGVKADIIPPIVAPPIPVEAAPTYTPEQLIWAAGLEDIRTTIIPPLYGEGFNLAIIDSGIRETHNKIAGRVKYSKNYTSDPMRDGLDHGTAVCSIVLAVAPLANILNLKVLNDEGEGSEEDVALAIDTCIVLHSINPDIAPTVINLSLGAPDDGNPSNPLRVACRAAIDRGIWVLASAGNGGPAPYSITCPACEAYVIAVGSASYEPFRISDWSSRGPTMEGLIKPDGVFLGENVKVASSVSDSATIAKTGTSFSVPFASGIIALYHESIIRYGGEVRYGGIMEYPAGIPPGIYTAAARIVTPQEMIDLYLPNFCIKPEGVATGKDNEYGYGLPFGPLILQAITPVAAIDIMASIAPILMIGMLGAVMSSMT